MTFSTDDQRRNDDARSSHRLTDEDRALVQAVSVWRRTGDNPAEKVEDDHFVSRIWERLDPKWSRCLREAWSSESADGSGDSSALALVRVAPCTRCNGESRSLSGSPELVDCALEEESPGVQRVVAISAPAPIRQAITDGLLIDAQDMAAARPINPEVQSWVLSLWTERLIGGEPARPDDPPVISVFSRLSPRNGYRLCQMAGIAKGVLAAQVPAARAPTARDRARWEWLQGRLAGLDDQFRQHAWKEVQSIAAPKVPRRHHAARIGLFTVARLLADCEPFRIRWAIQHWPYPIAKLLRSLMKENQRSLSATAQSESLLLKCAWDRLNLEGRLTHTWPDTEQGRAFNGNGSHTA